MTLPATEGPEIDQALADTYTFVADPAPFQLLTIYERRIHSNRTKNMKQPIGIRAIRHAVEAREKAARFHAQLAEMEGVPCENGFVYSTAELPNHPHRQPPESGQTRRILQLEPIRPPRRMSV